MDLLRSTQRIFVSLADAAGRRRDGERALAWCYGNNRRPESGMDSCCRSAHAGCALKQSAGGVASESVRKRAGSKMPDDGVARPRPVRDADWCSLDKRSAIRLATCAIFILLSVGPRVTEKRDS